MHGYRRQEVNMFKPANASSAREYFDMLPVERRSPAMFLDTFIRKAVPGLKPNFLYNMPGYGSFKYTNHKKEIIDWPTIAIASQEQYFSIYLCALEDGQYLAEKYKKQLGKVSVGKSCIRFKRIDDLNLGGLKRVLKRAAKSPGLISAGSMKNEKGKGVKMNPVVHFEMPAEDRKRMANFYAKAFGWKAQLLGPDMGDYVVVSTTESDAKTGRPKMPGAINGGFFPKKPDWPAQHPSVVIAVDDMQEHIKKVRQAGGKVLGEPMDIPGIGTYVSFIDTEGNRVSMLQASMEG